MTSWRLAPTLVQLRSEVNARWPLRDKTSDGTLGNAAHQARKSDHNPDSRNVVCAMDFDEDLNRSAGRAPSFRPGQGARAFVNRLIELAKAGKLPQLYYVIYERQIFSRTHNFHPRPYDGLNAHDHHVHVSVFHPPALADRRTPWGIGTLTPLPEGDDDMPTAREVAKAFAEELKDNDALLDAIAIRVRDHLFNDKVLATWHPDGKGGKWALHSLLRSIRQDTDANRQSLAKVLGEPPTPPADLAAFEADEPA